MTKMGILGANGRMGRVLIDACFQHAEAQLGFASVRKGSNLVGVDAGELVGVKKQNIPITTLESHNSVECDVIIDFTLPDALEKNLDWAVAHKTPIVIGTTGLSDKQLGFIDEAASAIPIVFAANYSVGVNLLIKLARLSSQVMGETSDIEILEAHHRFKKDAPSGTAIALGEAISDELGIELSEHAVFGREGISDIRDSKTIGFATVRAGDIVGEHTILFAALGERLELTHKASSRVTFANGAISAAIWLQRKNAKKSKGLFSMQDVLGLSQP